MMPEKIVQVATEWRDVLVAAGMAVIGALIGVGRVLGSKEKVATRIAIGRCLSNTGLAMAAGTVLLVIPGAPLLALFGLSAAIATLGTAVLERWIERLLGIPGKDKS